ncbi:hypothetical protein MOQ72_35380 [Saccharopolyspora sp. K220]|uniref:hypothetical protein n=1 Tax=Saccharopolyspora soli TaxID=2926618 RepID=UPI001F57DF9C|nr:hypothetical protein [Saccharopolyspora soli]MCI2422721.1 hypothetical protein [Saccharopolyspora soli]
MRRGGDVGRRRASGHDPAALFGLHADRGSAQQGIESSPIRHRQERANASIAQAEMRQAVALI